MRRTLVYNGSIQIYSFREALMNILLELDGQILLFIQEHIRCGALDGAMRLVTTLGNAGAIWIVTAIALLCFRRTRRF